VSWRALRPASAAVVYLRSVLVLAVVWAVLENSKFMVEGKLIEKPLAGAQVKGALAKAAPIMKEAYERSGRRPDPGRFQDREAKDVRGLPVWEIDRWRDRAEAGGERHDARRREASGMMDVGFIGLGTMGRPMAQNVLRGGYRLTVHDLDRSAVDALIAAGAHPAESPRAVGAASEVVITMLPNGPDVEQVALGPDGLIHGMRAGGVHVDMSTIDPPTTRRVGAALAARDIGMIDSPVGKTADHAVTGTLTLMIGGDRALVERCRPLLETMGRDLFYCGELGMGETMKVTNNLLATAVLAATAEALVLGVKAGLRLELMLDVMRTTMAWNSQLAVALPKRAFADDFAPGFMVTLARKDVGLAVELARGLGVDTTVGRATLEALDAAIARGLGAADVGAVLRLREEAAGVRVRPAAP
jgi:4-hydroxybutyrate dehydrogenase/sulfolactaldehyde 3-reductase